jgi:hypothetical protein
MRLKVIVRLIAGESSPSHRERQNLQSFEESVDFFKADSRSNLICQPFTALPVRIRLNYSTWSSGCIRKYKEEKGCLDTKPVTVESEQDLDIKQ